MIPLSLAQFVSLYVGVLVGLVFIASAIRTSHRRHAEARARRGLITCVLCGLVYENPSPDPIPACPNCGHPNERTPRPEP